MKSWVKVEMAGSSTNGTRNKNANTLTIHRVPVMKNVFYVLGCKVVLHTQLYLVFKVASLAVFGKSTSFTAKLCGRCNAQNDAVFSSAGFPNLEAIFRFAILGGDYVFCTYLMLETCNICILLFWTVYFLLQPLP